MIETDDPCCMCKCVISVNKKLGTPAVVSLIFDENPKTVFRLCEKHVGFSGRRTRLW